MSVTHYADEGEGVSFNEATMSFAPVEPFCGSGTEGDMMSWFYDQVTCAACKQAVEPGAS